MDIMTGTPSAAPQPSRDADTIARTAWGEARGEGAEGMQAVINVIMTRVRLRWKGDTTPAAVCLRHRQFSCWNPDDPNRPKLLAVTTVDPQFAQALTLAERALAGDLPDITNGADSYHVRGTRAAWADGLPPTESIGKHDFYITRRVHIV